MKKVPGYANVSVQISDKLVARIQKVKRHISMAEFIRRAIEKRVNDRESDPGSPEPYR